MSNPPELKDAAREIRLLELHPSDDHEALVSCTIKVFSLETCPSYEAISYVWGPPEPTRPIRLDGEPVEVRYNCWYALYQVRDLLKHKASGQDSETISPNNQKRRDFRSQLWIDAICIAQDNLAEKSLQVPLMARIFSQASTVLSSIVADSSLALRLQQVINESSGWKDYHHSWETIPVSQFAAVFSFLANFRELIDELCWHPYWHRLWIVQELKVADEVVLLIGDAVILWEDFEFCHKLLSNASIFDNDSFVNTLDILLKEGRSGLPWLAGPLTSGLSGLVLEAFQVMTKYAACECSEPVDRFSVSLNIARAKGIRGKFLVNYNETMTELIERILDVLRGDLDKHEFSLCLVAVSLLLKASRIVATSSEVRTLLQDDCCEDRNLFSLDKLDMLRIRVKQMSACCATGRGLDTLTENRNGSTSDKSLSDTLGPSVNCPLQLPSSEQAAQGWLVRHYNDPIMSASVRVRDDHILVPIHMGAIVQTILICEQSYDETSNRLEIVGQAMYYDPKHGTSAMLGGSCMCRKNMCPAARGVDLLLHPHDLLRLVLYTPDDYDRLNQPVTNKWHGSYVEYHSHVQSI